MMRPRLLSRRWLMLLPLVALLVVAIACGEAATPTLRPTATASPQPTATPTTEAVQPTATPTQEAVAAKPGFVDFIALAAKYGDNPKVGGKMLYSQFINFDHSDYQQRSGMLVLAPLLNGLIMSNPYDWKELMPDIAYKWEASPDFLKYTFWLHEGVRFHDGVEVTAETFRYTFERMRSQGVFNDEISGDEQTCPSCRGFLLDKLAKEFRAPEKYVFEIILEGPSSAILTLISDSYYSVIPTHLNELDRNNALRDDLKPIGTGPFRMAEEIETTLVAEERNPDYFKPGVPFLDTLDAHTILDVTTRATAVLTERIYMDHPDSTPYLPYLEAKALAEQDSGIEWVPITTYLNLFWSFNTRNPVLSDLRVRQALSLAVDRSVQVAEDPFRGTEGLGPQRGALGTTIFPQGKWAPPLEVIQTYIGYGPDMEARRTQARALLANYEADKGEIDWSKIPFHCANNHPSCDNAIIIKDQVGKIGVDLTLEPGETITAWQRLIDGDYTIGAMLGQLDFDDPMSFPARQWLFGEDWNFSYSKVQEAEDLYDASLFLADEDERRAAAWK